MRSIIMLTVAACLAACGDSSETISNIPEDEQTEAAMAALDASSTLDALTAADLPIAGIAVLTEETDDNKMMG